MSIEVVKVDYGITGFGGYVPRLRLARAAIADAHSWMNPSLRAAAKGERAFCSWDEDVVTMAVEAARDCLAGHDRDKLATLRLASTTFPYADMSNGVIVAAALALPASVSVENCAGSQRAATTALLHALHERRGDALVIAAERPVTIPASMAEIQSGAGAAALTLGDDCVIARLIGSATRAMHFVDHFRAADQPSDYGWEERWIRDEGYTRLVPEALETALTDAALTVDDIHHLILPSPIRNLGTLIARQVGFTGTINSGLDAAIGYCGAAHGLMQLAQMLATAEPGQRIAFVGFGQGADVLIFETTDLIGNARKARGLDGAIADKLVTGDYLRMLSFYDRIALDWGMRGEKGGGKAALTEHFRESHQLDSFTGGRCRRCDTVQFPVLAYCVNPACNAPAQDMEPHGLADEAAQIFTITSDWLSYHPAPPLAVGFIQFDVGARLLMEVVDAAPDQIVEGQAVRMVFRIKERDRARGYNRYFWKATPVASQEIARG